MRMFGRESRNGNHPDGDFASGSLKDMLSSFFRDMLPSDEEMQFITTVQEADVKVEEMQAAVYGAMEHESRCRAAMMKSAIEAGNSGTRLVRDGLDDAFGPESDAATMSALAHERATADFQEAGANVIRAEADLAEAKLNHQKLLREHDE